MQIQAFVTAMLAAPGLMRFTAQAQPIQGSAADQNATMPDLYLKRYKDKTCTPAERLGDDIAFKYNECHSFEEDFYFYGMRYQRDAKSKPHPKGTQCKIHMWSRWDCQGTFIGQFLDTSDPGEISPCLSTAFLGLEEGGARSLIVKCGDDDGMIPHVPSGN